MRYYYTYTRKAKIKKTTTVKHWCRCGATRNTYIAGESIKCCHHYRRTIWHLSVKFTCSYLLYNLAKGIPRCINERNTSISARQDYTQLLIVAFFIIAKIKGKSKCPSTEEWGKKDFLYIHEITFICRKERTTDTHNNMDKSQKTSC